MTLITVEIIGIFLLLMVNGVFAMTEIAVVSAAKRGSDAWRTKVMTEPEWRSI